MCHLVLQLLVIIHHRQKYLPIQTEKVKAGEFVVMATVAVGPAHWNQLRLF